MGARVSVAFKKGDQTSVTLFSHWGGNAFVEEAKEYVEKLKERNGGAISYPLDRLEPETVMVDFIRELTKDMERVESDLYLGKNGGDGDNSDYGHHEIELTK